jgi:hypothetical protein
MKEVTYTRVQAEDTTAPVSRSLTFRLRVWHGVVATLHVATAVAMFIFIANRQWFFDGGHIPLACLHVNTSAFVPDERMEIPFELDRHCGTYDLIVSCAVLHALTAIAHAQYWRMAPLFPGGWRWVEYYFSGAIVVVHTALTTGTRDWPSLVFVATATASIQPFGFSYERAQAKDRTSMTNRDWWLKVARTQGVGWVLFGAALAVILTNFFALADVAPDFVTAIIIIQTVLLSLFAFINVAPLSDAAREVAYTSASVSSKIIPTWIALMSILK